MKLLATCVGRLLVAGALGLAGPRISAAVNLVPDASFESTLPSWFSEKGGINYYAGKELVKGAPDGKYVLAIQGWEKGGSRILSPVFPLDSASYSGGISARSFGKVDNATVELALFDEKGAKKLASFGSVPVDGKEEWIRISKTAVPVTPPAARGRLAIVVKGPQDGARVEVDLAGLFAGDTLGPLADNRDDICFEAEELADGKVWVKTGHYRLWYTGFPSGMEMIAGMARLKAGENKPVGKDVAIRNAGKHRLWVRFLMVNRAANAGRFTVAVDQNGKTLGVREFFDGDEKYTIAGKRKHSGWVWDSLDVDLDPGPARIVLTRPDERTSHLARKVDFFLLTDRLDYQPKIEDFGPKGYMRFTNLTEGVEPFCLWIHVRHHQKPVYANPGVLSAAGLSQGYRAPGDPAKRLLPGRPSPWVRISDFLNASGGRNNVSLTATRASHAKGFVEGRIKGVLEFAVGDERKVVRTIAVDQDAPRILLTLPENFATKADEIRAPDFYIKQTEDEIARLGPPRGKPAKRLALTTGLALQVGLDDPDVIHREVQNLKNLGFNGLYVMIAPADRAMQYYETNGLQTRFGCRMFSLWISIKDQSQHHPDLERLDSLVKQFAEKNGPILEHIRWFQVMDEPGGMSYESIAQSEPCKRKFIEYLKTLGLTPADLKVKDWTEAAPVPPADSQARPELFYHSGMFRLEAFATLARACAQAKKKYMPNSCYTYVNYAPPHGGKSLTFRGTDPFLAQRNGGLEMGWTEDWLDFGLGVQHLSETLALLRAAGRPTEQPLGGHCVGDTLNPVLMRMKYYTLVAGGVRDINTFNYGPWYAGHDSWGRKFEIYPAIRTAQFELGVIDEALAGTTRRKTDIAILYNRAAYIWEKGTNSFEQNGWYTHWALAHAGYDADFIPEEDVESGLLSGYKALYFDGPQVRRRTAEAVADWVNKGGVLFGTAGAGSRDEYDRQLDVLEKVFGARSDGLEHVVSAGRPKHDLPGLKALDNLTAVPGGDTPPVGFAQLCVRERLIANAGATVILTTASGGSAGAMMKFGKGTAIRVAALPGISYVHDAAKPPYKIDTYLPKSFRPELKDFLAWPARLAHAFRVAESFAPIAEIVRYDGPARAVIFVIDHRAEPVEKFAFKLNDAGTFSQAYSASGNPVTLKNEGGGVLGISLAMNGADSIVLQK